MRKIFLSIFFCGIFGAANAQDPHFSQFFASPLTLNPAFTGKFDGAWRIAANHRDQWPSIPKAYVTTSASFDIPILKSRIPEGDVFGIGISGVSDASANSQLKLNYGSLSLSYHKALDANGYNTIGVGFQATYSSMNLDISKLTFESMLQQNGFTGESGEVFQNGNNQNYIDFNAGVLFSGSSNGYNNYYIGASMYHINKPKVGFKDQNWYLNNRLTVHGGGTFPLTDVLQVNASFIHQMQNKASETMLGAALGFTAGGEEDRPTIVYLGSWMRFNDAIVPYVGLEFNNFRLGASYDVNVSGLKAATNNRGGSEFSLIYIHRPVEMKGIPCPKF
jgi:type IX secretion system PorP/SprF family membrane protein